jgi:hypothetical protein
MEKKKIIIFIGPSLPSSEAKKILNADYRGPVARDDVLKALNDKPYIIGIIDGVFHQKPAVSHKELLKALKSDVTIVGGASMGALRASELDDFGMIGVGRVYESYKNGDMESDDDVAVVFNQETMEQLSEALVNITFNFQKACIKGLITKSEMKNLLEIAKSIYYPKRTYKQILNYSNINIQKKNSLKSFLDKEGIDVKREDAILVLKRIKSIIK